MIAEMSPDDKPAYKKGLITKLAEIAELVTDDKPAYKRELSTKFPEMGKIVPDDKPAYLELYYRFLPWWEK